MDDQTKLLIGSMIVSNLPTIAILAKYILKKEKELTEIQVLLKLLQKDVDGIADFIGTPRAIARKKSVLQSESTDSGAQ